MSIRMSIRYRTALFAVAAALGGITVPSVSAIELSGGNVWTFYKNKALALHESTVTWQEYYLPAPINHLDADDEGTLWFATKKGLSRYKDTAWETFSPDNTLSGPFINDLFLCLAGGRGDTLWAGTSTGGLVRYTDTSWTTYDTTDGLPSMKVTALLQSRNGTVWAGTADGLAALNNGSFSIYPAGKCLLGRYVRSLTEDTRGNLWVECYSYTGVSLDEMKTGMCRFDGTSWSQYRFSHPITHVLPSRSGLVWLVTRNRQSGTSTLFTYTKKRWAAVDSSHLGINRLAADSSGQLWVATDGGLYRYDGKNWHGVPQTLGKQVTTVYVDSRNHLWCSYSDDNRSMFIGELTGDTWQTCSLFPEKNITVITETPDCLWFGASGGLIRYFKGSWRIFDELHHSVSIHIRDMAYQSAQDRLWVATEKGVARLDRFGIWHASVNSGLNQHHVYSANCLADNELWINSYNWHRLDRTGWHPYNERYSYSPAGNPLEYASPGPDSSVWFWSADLPEVVVLNHGRLTAYPSVKNAVTAFLKNLKKIPGGAGNGLWLEQGKTVWAVDRGAGTFSHLDAPGTWQDTVIHPLGAVRFAPDSIAVCSQYRLYKSGDTRLIPCILPDHLRFRDIAAGPDGTLWLESGSELVRFSPDGCRIFPFPAGGNQPVRPYQWTPIAETLTVSGLAPDAAGRIWLATGQGPGHLTAGTFSWLKAKNRLPRPDVKAIVAAPQGIWALHDFGASLLHKNKWRHYTVREGLISNLLHGAVTGPDGTFYVFAPYGISEYRGGTWTNQTLFGTIEYPNVQDICPTPDGTLILATLSGLLIRNGNTWSHIGRAGGLPADSIYAVAALPAETLLIATGSGIYKTLNGKTVHQARQPRCGSGSRFLTAPDGTLWLAAGSGKNPAKRMFKNVRGAWQEAFRELHVTCAAFDRAGHLHLGSPGGIFSINAP